MLNWFMCYRNKLIIGIMLIFCSISMNGLAVLKQFTTSDAIKWNTVETKDEDLDKDNKKDKIILSTYEYKIKIQINNVEKLFVFDPSKTIGVTSVSIKQFIKLDKGKKGILIKLNTEGETFQEANKVGHPFDHDHSFIVVDYTKWRINTILDGVKLPFKKQSNYRVKYMGNYKIDFLDIATKFNVKYFADIYKSQTDGEQSLKSINSNNSLNISNNFFNIKLEDLNSDGVDEITCSKYLPGFYHADILGIIDYTFSYKKGQYSLSKEALSYYGKLIESKKF